jgi:hypothetical protein
MDRLDEISHLLDVADADTRECTSRIEQAIDVVEEAGDVSDTLRQRIHDVTEALAAAHRRFEVEVERAGDELARSPPEALLDSCRGLSLAARRATAVCNEIAGGVKRGFASLN